MLWKTPTQNISPLTHSIPEDLSWDSPLGGTSSIGCICQCYNSWQAERCWLYVVGVGTNIDHLTYLRIAVLNSPQHRGTNGYNSESHNHPQSLTHSHHFIWYLYRSTPEDDAVCARQPYRKARAVGYGYLEDSSRYTPFQFWLVVYFMQYVLVHSQPCTRQLFFMWAANVQHRHSYCEKGLGVAGTKIEHNYASFAQTTGNQFWSSGKGEIICSHLGNGDPTYQSHVFDTPCQRISAVNNIDYACQCLTSL